MGDSKYPFVISLPHCSGSIPPEIRDYITLTDQQIEESTDTGTREIFGSLPVLGIFCAFWSRLAVDLNRSSDQRDRKGVVPHVDYGGREIYPQASLPDGKEVERRVRLYYRPFHAQLQRAIADDEVMGLFDCHSLNGIGPPGAPDPGERRKDIVLSNNGDECGCSKPALGGITCSTDLLKGIKGVFENSGFSVSLNRPYSGGYVTTHYGRYLCEKGKMALQIEINQDLYCTRGTLNPVPARVEDVRQRMRHVFSRLSWLAGRLRNR